jgi:hypothetical protein
MLTADLAAAFARTALANVNTPYPYKLDQLLGDARDLAPPDALHPAFWGSYDWHSCVHMHWTLVRLLRLQPAHAQARASRAHLAQRLAPATIAGELATLRGPLRSTFERPYGWGWLLKLAVELEALADVDPAAAPWRDALRPLADVFAQRFVAFLPRATYATRAGTHGNSAFAIRLALDWAERMEHAGLRAAIAQRAREWFGSDRRYPAHYEPSGDDFLSAGLVEAVLMRRVLDPAAFRAWWRSFAPPPAALDAWLVPVTVSDPSDARIVHLHGVNLCRAWCWRALLPVLPSGRRPAVERAAAAHLAAALPAATAGDYVGTHWLASFALLALTEPG